MTFKPETKLYAVTREGYNGEYTIIESLKELQSSVTRYNSIISIKPVKISIGKNEVDIEEIKPTKYKGRPYTYFEKCIPTPIEGEQ